MFVDLVTIAGRPRFGSVRLRFGGGTVRAVPVFGSGGSSAKRVCLCFSTVSQERTVPVPVSVPGRRFRRFRFRFRFRGKRFRQFRFPVPVRFLSHRSDPTIGLWLFKGDVVSVVFMPTCSPLAVAMTLV